MKSRLKSNVYSSPQPSKGCANYSKSTCQQALIQARACLSGMHQNNSNVVITANVDQEASESTAQLIVNGLPLLGATEACTSSFVPFMCLYLFPLCDGNGTVTRPSRDQCIEISTVVCKDEWQKALAISGVKEQLPNCEHLTMATARDCKGNIGLLSQENLLLACLQIRFGTKYCCRGSWGDRSAS